MTQEWIDWSSENRMRAPLRGAACNNYLNNNYANNKMATAMGHKTTSMMKSLQRPKGRNKAQTKTKSIKFQMQSSPRFCCECRRRRRCRRCKRASVTLDEFLDYVIRLVAEIYDFKSENLLFTILFRFLYRLRRFHFHLFVFFSDIFRLSIACPSHVETLMFAQVCSQISMSSNSIEIIVITHVHRVY